MATYSKKSCNSCGILKPANEMYKVPKIYTTKSKNVATWRDWAGSALGSKTSQKSLSKALFSGGGRKHTRTGEVWSCGPCAGIPTPEELAEIKRRKEAFAAKVREEEKKRYERERERIAAEKRRVAREEANKRKRVAAVKTKASEISLSSLGMEDRVKNFYSLINNDENLAPKHKAKLKSEAERVFKKLDALTTKLRVLQHNPEKGAASLNTNLIYNYKKTNPKKRLLDVPRSMRWGFWFICTTLTLIAVFTLLSVLGLEPEAQGKSPLAVVVLLLVICSIWTIWTITIPIRRQLHKLPRTAVLHLDNLSNLEKSVVNDISKLAADIEGIMNTEVAPDTVVRKVPIETRAKSNEENRQLDRENEKVSSGKARQSAPEKRDSLKSLVTHSEVVQIAEYVLYSYLVNADQKVSKEEEVMLRELSGLGANEIEVADQILKYDLSKQVARVLKLKYDKSQSRQLIDNLIAIAASDNDIDNREATLIKDVARELEVSLSHVSQRISKIKREQSLIISDDESVERILNQLVIDDEDESIGEEL